MAQYRFTIQGSGPGPLATVLAEGVVPDSAYAACNLSGRTDQRTVALYAYKASANWQPTAAMWTAAGWTVQAVARVQ